MRKNPPGCCNQLAACSLSLRVLPGCLPACCPYCPAGSVHAWRRSRGQGGRGNGNVGKTFPRAAPELLWLDEKEICILTDATGINIWLLAIFSWQNNRRPAASCCCCYLLWKPQLKWPTTIRPIASCELRTANDFRKRAARVGVEARELAGCVHDTLTQWTFGMQPSRLATATVVAIIVVVVVATAAAALH